MTEKQNRLIEKLLTTFNTEANERFESLSSALLALENASHERQYEEILETIFREVHSLKGAARAVSKTDIEKICQAFESVLVHLKREQVRPAVEAFDTFHRVIKVLKELLAGAREGEKDDIGAIVEDLAGLQPVDSGAVSNAPIAVPPSPEAKTPHSDHDDKTPGGNPEKLEKGPSLHAVESIRKTNAEIASFGPGASPSKTVRIGIEKLDSMLLQIEEMLSIKLALGQRRDELFGLLSYCREFEKEFVNTGAQTHEIRKYLEQDHDGREENEILARFSSFIEYFDRCVPFLNSLEKQISKLIISVKKDQRNFGKLVNSLLEDSKTVLMFPFSSVLEAFPGMVRELSRKSGKESKLEMDGTEIRIDRRILDEIKDPLIHLIRNCIDHGIEKPETRQSAGKPAHGLISIAVVRMEGNKVRVTISDDGAGIDPEIVKASALKKGMISPDGAGNLSEQEILQLVFQSGFSTSPIITEVSGRGLGLAIVREKVEKLGGLVSVRTETGKRTSFEMILPITSSTFRGVLCEAGDMLFVVPLKNVRCVLGIKPGEIKTIENKETVSLSGRAISYVRLNEVLEIPGRKTELNKRITPALVLVDGKNMIAFGVDRIHNEQEILVKSLGKQLSRVRNINGATVLGSGKVIPILNVSDLMKSAINISSDSHGMPVAAGESERKQRSILVVEDSITSRMFLKNILESSGYSVKTAVDGIDALTALKSEEIDLIVSDVQMPRMNGFELTSRIKNTPNLAELPVILVTALESREDKERGIDVGASAYIVKSNFDQNNLLDAVKRLIS